MLPQLQDSPLVEQLGPGLAFVLALGGFSALMLVHRYQRGRRPEDAKGVAIPTVAGILPWLGKGLEFSTDPLRFMLESKKKYGSFYQMTVWGNNVAVVSDPAILSAMEAQPNALSTSIPRQDAFKALTGIPNPERVAEVMETTMTPIAARALSPSALSEPSSSLLTAFDEKLSSLFREFATSGVDTSDGSIVLPLSDFVAHNVFSAMTTAFFGPTFPDDSYADYALLSSHVELLQSPVSNWPFVARNALAARGRIMQSLIKYIEEWWYADGCDEIEGISPLMLDLLKGAKEEELTLEEAAGTLLFVLWGPLVCVWSTTFWLMREVLTDADAHGAIAREARSTYGQAEKRLLDSAVQESLRWAPAVPPVRYVERDTEFVVGGKRYFLPVGTRIIADPTGYHCDSNIFSEPDQFKAGRFLDESIPRPKPSGEKQDSKGMQLSQLQIKSFVTMAFRSFNFKVASSGVGKPAVAPRMRCAGPLEAPLIEITCR